MYKPKPRCNECGCKLTDGHCTNPECVACMIWKLEEEKKKKEAEDVS